MTYGIIVAMEKEFEALLGKRGNFEFGRTESGNRFVVLVSGIGKVNAAVAAYRLIKDFEADEVLSLGCAGGMEYSVRVGDVVIGESYCYHDVWCGEPNERGQVQGHPMIYGSNAGKWASLVENPKCGLIVTGDALVENEIMADAIIQTIQMNPLAVDMESAAIAQVCDTYGTPFTSIRVISDNPRFGFHAKEYRDFWKHKDKTLSSIFQSILSR